MSATLKLAEPRASLLDSLLTLMRDDRADLPALLTRLVAIRGIEGAINDVLDGLILTTERDDFPSDDCDATRALLESLQQEVRMRTERARRPAPDRSTATRPGLAPGRFA